MNIENIKSQFPIFSKKVNGKPLVYLDSSNSSQKPLSVINRLDSFYKNEFSNIGRSIHSLSVNATNKFDETRESVKKFINADTFVSVSEIRYVDSHLPPTDWFLNPYNYRQELRSFADEFHLLK